MMEHKGYVGVVEYDPDARHFAGRVVNTRDMIAFRGESVEELEREFRSAVEAYLKWVAENGGEARKPLGGDFLVRTGDPALHGLLSIAATRAGESLNAYVVRVLREHLAARQAAFGSLLLGDDVGQPLSDAGSASSGARKTRKPRRPRQPLGLQLAKVETTYGHAVSTERVTLPDEVVRRVHKRGARTKERSDG